MKKQLEAGQQLTQEQAAEAVKAILNNTELSKSKKMIAMFDLGLETKDIAEIMTAAEGKMVRYNFVYNVISNHCNINGIKREETEKTGKKDLIIAMYLAGKSNKEISIELKTNYNYVFNTIKQFKLLDPRRPATEAQTQVVVVQAEQQAEAQ